MITLYCQCLICFIINNKATRLINLKKIKKNFYNKNIDVDFTDIDRKILVGFECSEFNFENRKFLSMIREQTNSAINNKKYWITN